LGSCLAVLPEWAVMGSELAAKFRPPKTRFL
jgi:hypothetical protein